MKLVGGNGSLHPIIIKVSFLVVSNNTVKYSKESEPPSLLGSSHTLFLFQLSDDGEADYDMMLGLLPEQFHERAGKMIDKCRHISKYGSTRLTARM